MAKQVRTLIAMLVVLAFVVISCQGTAPAATAVPSASEKAATVAPSPLAAAQPTAAATAPARKPEGTLTIALSTLFEEIFFPAFGAAPPKNYYDLIYEYLVYIDPDTWELQPGLATKWEYSPDGKVWTFHLRPGVKFHDGTEFTSADAKYSVEILLQYPKTVHPNLPTLKQNYDHADTPDPYTIVFYLKSPYPEWAAMLSNSTGIPIVSKAYAEAQGLDYYNAHPIGTGPYKFLEFKPGESVRLEAKDEHWRQVGAFKQVVFRKVPEPGTRSAMLKAGEADIIELPRELMTDAQKDGMKVVAVPGQSFSGIAFSGLWLPDKKNYDPSLPWAKKEVREAIALAINRDEIAKTFYNGAATPTGVPIYFMPYDPFYNPDWKPYPFDPEKAKQLLAKAGYPKGFSTTFEVMPQGGAAELPALGELVQQYLSRIGIDLKLVRTDWAVFRPTLLAREKPNRMWIYRGFPQADPFYTKQILYESTNQFGLYENPDIDKLFAAARPQVDLTKRYALLRQIGDQLYQDYATIPIVEADAIYGVGPKVADWKPTRGKFPDRYEYAVPARR